MKEAMQIQLNQNEIETALKNYVSSLFTLSDNVEVAITLKATRGDDGQTAIIDIVPRKEVSPAPAVATRRPRAVAVTKAEESPKDVKAAESNEAPSGTDTGPQAEEGNAEASSQTSSDAGATDQSAEDVGQAGSVAEAAAEAEAPAAEAKPKTSLFANVRRPVNS